MGLEPEFWAGQKTITLHGQMLLGSLQRPAGVDLGVISITNRRCFSLCVVIEKSVYLVSQTDVRGYDIIFDLRHL